MGRFLLQMNFKTQGTIKSPSTKHGPSFSHGVICHGFDFPVSTPTDTPTGHTSGKRQHKPVVIRKEVDAASPLIFQALVTNETFTTATIDFGPGRIIKLTNGTIHSIKPAKDPSGKKCEDLTIDFDSMTVNGVPNLPIPHSWILDYKIARLT